MVQHGKKCIAKEGDYVEKLCNFFFKFLIIKVKKVWKPFEDTSYISNTKAEDIHDSDSTILQHFRLFSHGAIFSLNPSVNIAETVQIYFFPMEKHHPPYNEAWFPRKSPFFKFLLFKLWERVGQLESAYT